LPVAGIALADLTLLVATAGGYGYHRDELYFVEAGKHPAWGYDDQPPLTPLIGRLSAALFGQTPRGLRVASAVVIALCVVLAALTARELGGGRRPQVLASAATGSSGALLAGHLLSTETFDILAWTALLFLVTRILAGGDRRLWLAAGALGGVALLNKNLILLLVASLVVAAVLGGRGELLRSPWPWAGAAIALALWAPNLAWQASRGWPQLTLAHQIANEDPVGTRVGFLPFQLVLVGLTLAAVWIAGLVWLLRRREARPFRVLGLAYLVLAAICLLTGAKAYYIAAYYFVLLAAGAVALERWLAPARRRALAGAGVAVALAASAVIGLPLIPAKDIGGSPVASINPDALEQIGWPRFADTIAGVYRRLPRPKRAHAVVFTENYGEAGALRRYRPERRLPPAYSGHNSFADFGRPRDGAQPVILVGFRSRAEIAGFFAGCRVVARIDNGVGVDNEEQGGPVWLCRAPRRPWSELWPRLHHLDA
jgi:4-amino-4-deoxy-L-arabinose transferase-like glycosyltransferase